MTLITRTCSRYAGSVKKKLEVSPLLPVRVLSSLEANIGRDITKLEKSALDPVQEIRE